MRAPRSLLIDTYIKDQSEKHRLFNAIETVPCVQKKANWCAQFLTRLLCPVQIFASEADLLI